MLVARVLPVVFAAIFLLAVDQCATLHLTGTFNTKDFFKFIGRFGIQSTDVHDQLDTRGYIYGNITLLSIDSGNGESKPLPRNSLMMLTVMDYNYFINYYKNRLVVPRSAACPMMFETIKKAAFFFECAENNTQDFIRRVPCPSGRLCLDEDNEQNVIAGNQFTFKIQDFNQARFWYVSLVACTRDTTTCEWRDLSGRGEEIASEVVTTQSSPSITTAATGAAENGNDSTTGGRAAIMNKKKQSKSSVSYTIAYDIWMVNGNPRASVKRRFTHQFSYELHDVLSIYMCSFLVYMCILPFIWARVRHHFHHLYALLLVYVGVECTSRFVSLVHSVAFSYTGSTLVLLQMLSDFLEAFASSILMFILVCIAKGWTIRSSRLKTSQRFYAFGLLLQSVLILSHMISLSTIDPVFNTNSYETSAGYVELGIRVVCMIWFLVELKNTAESLEQVAVKNSQSSTHKTECFSDNDDDEDDEYEIRRGGKKYKSLREHDDMQRAAAAASQRNNNHNNNNVTTTSEDETLSVSQRLRKYQKFYLHYGACCLVWFIYLPILIFITSFVSELYRHRLVISIRYFVNFLSVCVILYIFWSPKTPLRLPGKKQPEKYDEIVSLHYFYGNHDHEDNMAPVDEDGAHDGELDNHSEPCRHRDGSSIAAASSADGDRDGVDEDIVLISHADLTNSINTERDVNS